MPETIPNTIDSTTFELSQDSIQNVMRYLQKVIKASEHGVKITGYEFHKGAHKAYCDIYKRLTSKKQ